MTVYQENEFNYTTQQFTDALATRGGKARLDRYGQPLTSLRVKQTAADKQRMIERMLELYDSYKRNQDLFPSQPHQHGVDPVAMSTERVFDDLWEQAEKWLAKPNNDVLESFIHRHNYMVDYLKKRALLDDPTGSDAAAIEMGFGIRKVRKNATPAKRVIKTNFDQLFTVKSGYGQMPAPSDHPGLDD